MLIFLWIGLVRIPENSPLTVPIIIRIPMFEVYAAAEPTVTPPVIVPIRTYFSPRKPLFVMFVRAKPIKVPTTLPIRAKSIENLFI